MNYYQITQSQPRLKDIKQEKYLLIKNIGELLLNNTENNKINIFINIGKIAKYYRINIYPDDFRKKEKNTTTDVIRALTNILAEKDGYNTSITKLLIQVNGF